MSMERLEELRAKKRLAELRAKRDGAASAPAETSLNPFAGASVGENLSAAYDTAKSLGGNLMDRVGSFTDAVNPLTPLARVAGNAVGAALDPDKDYAQYVADDNAERDARDERVPGLYKLAGTVANPVNKMAGLTGVGTSAATNALNNEIGAVALDSDKDQETIAKEGGLETAIGIGANFLPKAIAPLVKSGTEKLGSMADDLAQYFGKRALGGTKSQLAELDVATDKLPDAVRTLRNEGVFDKAIQSKQDLYDSIKKRRQASGQASDDIFTANAKPVNQAETYDKLMAQAKEYRNKGQSEIAAKLENEASVIKDIDSKPLGIEQPITTSPENLKYIEMQNTDLDPSIIKGRKTQLDNETYKSQVETNKTAEAAGDELREMQYGLVEDPAAKAALGAENAKYGDFKTAEKLAKAQAAGDKGLGGGLMTQVRRIGLTNLAVASGNPLLAGASLAGDILLSKYGNQLATYGFNKSSRVLQNQNWSKQLLDAAERGGAAAVGSTHFLLTQRDPEYRKAHQEDQEASKE